MEVEEQTAVSKPRFSWEPVGTGSLRIRVTCGDREVSWTVRKNMSAAALADLFEEVSNELLECLSLEDPGMKGQIVKGAYLDEVPGYQMTNYLVQDTVTEKMSMDALKAKAAEATAHGGQWWNDEVNMLPFKNTTHGEEDDE